MKVTSALHNIFMLIILLYLSLETVAANQPLTLQESREGQILAYHSLSLNDQVQSVFDDLADTQTLTADLQFYKAMTHCNKIKDANFLMIPVEAGLCLNQLKDNHKAKPTHLPTLVALFHYRINAPAIAGGSNDAARHLLNKIKPVSIHTYNELNFRYLKHIKNTEALNNFALKGVNQHLDLNYQFNSSLVLINEGMDQQGITTLQSLADQTEDNYIRLAALYQLGKYSATQGKDLHDGWRAITSYLNQKKTDQRLPSDQWAAFRLSQILHASGYQTSAEQIQDQLRQLNQLDKDLSEELKH